MNLDDQENYIRSINKFIIMFSLLEYGIEYMFEICDNKFEKFGLEDILNLYQTKDN